MNLHRTLKKGLSAVLCIFFVILHIVIFCNFLYAHKDSRKNSAKNTAKSIRFLG